MKLQDLMRQAKTLPFDALNNEPELVKQIQIRLKALSLLQGEADGRSPNLFSWSPFST